MTKTLQLVDPACEEGRLRSTLVPIARASMLGSLACTLGLAVAPAVAQDAKRASTPDIVVTGERDDQPLAVDRITTSIVDTPQAISRVTAAELQNRGVTSLTDAVRVIPGISLGAGETSWQGNNIILRGFTTRNDTFLDGMRDYGYYNRDPFADAEIEVLKGPASTLFGRGSTGGVINQASKVPQLTPLAEIELTGGTDGTGRATFDVDQPLSAATAVRVNGMVHTSQVADRDAGLSRRWGVAPSIAFGLQTPTRLTLSYFHQTEHDRPDYGIPWFNGAPAAVARNSYYGFSSDYLDTDVNIVTAKIEHDLSSQTTLRLQARYSNDTRSFRTSEAVIAATVAPTTRLGQITVTRNEFSGSSRDTFLQGQADVTTHLATGPFAHTLVAGFEAGRETPRPAYIFHVGVIGTSLVNPPAQTFAETAQYVRLTARTQADSVAAYAIDSITLGSRWSAILGARWDHVDAHYASTGYTPAGAIAATTAIDRTDARATWRAALVYKPAAEASLYASYATSFEPSAEGIESLISAGRSVAQANLDVAPETGRIFEVGGKWSTLGDRLLLTAAAFDIVKNNVRVPDPVTPSVNTNGGTQRVRGFELEAVGALTRLWSVRANYTFLDSTTLSSDNQTAAGSPRIGGPLPITPRNSATLEIDRAIGRLSLGGGLLYQSSRYGQDTNSTILRAPGYVVFEARGRYRIAQGLTAQVNVYNLGDKLYYDQLHPFHVVPGAGRSALFSLIWNR